MGSLNCSLSEKAFIPCLFIKDIFAECTLPEWQFFLTAYWRYSTVFLLALFLRSVLLAVLLAPVAVCVECYSVPPPPAAAFGILLYHWLQAVWLSGWGCDELYVRFLRVSPAQYLLTSQDPWGLTIFIKSMKCLAILHTCGAPYSQWLPKSPCSFQMSWCPFVLVSCCSFCCLVFAFTDLQRCPICWSSCPCFFKFQAFCFSFSEVWFGYFYQHSVSLDIFLFSSAFLNV